MNSDEQRLEELEIKMMDLENSIQQLNHVIIRQSEEIDSLRLAQSHLLKQLAASERSGNLNDEQRQIDADNAPPPHY